METLGFRRQRFTLYVSLLMPAFSPLGPPGLLTQTPSTAQRAFHYQASGPRRTLGSFHAFGSSLNSQYIGGLFFRQSFRRAATLSVKTVQLVGKPPAEERGLWNKPGPARGWTKPPPPGRPLPEGGGGTRAQADRIQWVRRLCWVQFFFLRLSNCSFARGHTLGMAAAKPTPRSGTISANNSSLN